MTIPIWLFVTFIYAVLVVLALFQMAHESSNSAFGVGGLTGCFTIPLLTILYLLYWIVHLATGSF
jgi:hypothetical protein